MLTAGSISIEGRRWPLAITHGVLLTCERETGLDVLNSFRIVQAPSSVLLALLWATLAAAGAQYSRRALGALFTLRNLQTVRRALLKAWVESMPEWRPGPPGAKDDDPFTYLRAVSFARLELGLSYEEWLDATPRQIQALSDIRLRHMQWQELMFGNLGSELVNHSFCKPETPRTPQSFMIHPFDAADLAGPSKTAGRLNSGEHILGLFLKQRGTKVVGYKGR